ncbi:MAG: hypothetical protein FWH06_07300 [Oscillospiraceae bacterium]|nr:hypothetical protein [Oscillospiraceae bacterium]
MKKLNIPTGMVELEINGSHVLRVNPGDPEVYAGCMELCRELPELSKSLRARTDGLSLENPDKNTVESALAEARALDGVLKKRLAGIFGCGFNGAFDGVSLLAIAENGRTVFENLLAAVTPMLESGLNARREKLRDQAAEAVSKASARRARTAPKA